MPRGSLSGLSLAILSLFSLLINDSFALPAECETPADGGNCQRSLYRYYYDHATGDCQRFIYTGCGGNSNRFIRRSHCREKCLEGRTPPGQEKRQILNTQETLIPMSSHTLPLSPVSTSHSIVPSVADDSTPPPAPHCTGCDPLFGICLPDGKCGCKQGYEKMGRICVDLDECELSGVCPDTATCINTLGGFHCNCGPDTKCDPKLDPYEHLTPPPPPSTNRPFIYTPPSRPIPTTDLPGLDESVCTEPFDMKINENCGVMLPRFYYESITKECRAVLYGGCTLTSKNVFVSRKDCEGLCIKKIFKPRVTPIPDENSIQSHIPSSPVSPPPSTPPASTTRFPPLPWELTSTTTSPDPFGLLSRVRSTSPATTTTTDQPQPAPSISIPSERVDLPQPAPTLPPVESDERVDDVLVPSSPSTCLLPFDESLRQECITSTWTERFYYDSHEKSCVAFWYDSSCQSKDREGKNEFATEEECMRCKNGFDPKKDLIDITPPLSISLKEKNHFTTHSPLEIHEEKEEEEEEEGEEEGDRVEVTRLPYFELIYHSTSTSTSTPLPHEEVVELEDDEEEEKKKTEAAYLAIKNSGSCSGILDTRLEDDCDEGNWEMRYFFSSDRGSCRPFWYGGCQLDVHNFYPTLEACKLSCGSHYAVEPSHFNRTVVHYERKEDKKEEEKTTTTPIPITTTTAEVISWTTKLAPIDISISGEETTTTSTHAPPTPGPSLPAYTVYPIEHSIKNRGSISYTTTEKPHPAEEDYEETEQPPSIPAGAATDPCEDPIDPKLEEECTETWEYRAYFDAAAKKCVKFWFGGCEVKSRNLFLDAEACRAVCHHKFTDAPVLTTIAPPPTTPTAPSTTSIIPTSAPLRESVDDLPQSAPLTATDPSLDPSLDLTQQTPESFEDDPPQAPPGPFLPSEPSPNLPRDLPHDSTGEMRTSRMPGEIKDQSVDTVVEEDNEVKRESTISLKGFTASFVTKVTVRTARESPPPQENELQEEEETTPHSLDSVTQSTSNEPTTLAFTSSTESYVPSWECLGEHRRESSARECGKEGRNWTQRYFFDHATRACRMYWGCEGSSSPNNFPDLLTCQWKCEPQRILPNVKSCLDPLDPSLEEDCNEGDFKTKFHFDFQTKKCVSFHYGGCRSASRNIFDGVEECKSTCERPDHTVSQSCLEPFDRGFLNTCNVNSRFEPKYYFDSSTGSCEMFWWGGCRRGAANFFVSLETCKWSCERPKRSEGPKQCQDKFDKQLTEACQDGQWRERFYFNHEKSSCVPFWWDGCHSESANFFRDRDSCQSLCERNPDAEIGSVASTLKEEFRCLEQKKVGDCRETYPAYYYDRVHRECRPFSYSGCGGNGNRFLTLAQCEGLCRPFTLLSEVESSCYLPLDTGHSEGECGKAATVSFHFDRSSGSCAQFWFRGCGGNGNRFDSIATCNRICAVKRRTGPAPIRRTRSTHACFESSADKGICPGGNSSSLPRYSYQGGKCVLFTWSGCGGSNNRFHSQRDCEQLCGGLKPSNTPSVCSYDADWGPCNQLSNKWFFNQSTGFCAQFLYGGCGGNPNRFDAFDTCQKTCEVTGIDVCMEGIDRGHWCEPMSNRYYYHKKRRKCIGFHYTGCGDSNNNFKTLEECVGTCEKRHGRSLPDTRPFKGNKRNLYTPPPMEDRIIREREQRAPKGKKRPPTGATAYKQTKPLEKSEMQHHIILEGNGTTYHKSAPQWVDHNLCFAYRYNITGPDAKLETHLCAKESSQDCWSEIIPNTEGDELCHVVRPFLKGTHKYTWFFSIIGGDFVNGRRSREGLRAAIMILQPSICHHIC